MSVIERLAEKVARQEEKVSRETEKLENYRDQLQTAMYSTFIKRQQSSQLWLSILLQVHQQKLPLTM